MDDLETRLLACGFDRADANIVAAAFLSGIANLMEAKGASHETVGEVLTEEEVREVLFKAIADRVAQLPTSEQSQIEISPLLEAAQ